MTMARAAAAGSVTVAVLSTLIAVGSVGACAAPSGPTAGVAETGGKADDPLEPGPGWCARIAGGVRSQDDPVLGLSALHSAVRYFGTEPTMGTIDNALVQAIDAAGSETGALPYYARALEGVCQVSPSDGGLPAARVEVRDGIVFVRPGTGAIAIPPDGPVVLDLLELPDVDGLGAAIDAAVGPLLALALPPVQRAVHLRTGLTDEAFAAEDFAYLTSVERLAVASPDASARAPRSLAVLLGPQLAPASALMAARLRIASLAWLIGADVPVSVAESRWVPVGQDGAVYRYCDLEDSRGRWPDVIARDFDDLRSLGPLLTDGYPPSVGRRIAERPQVTARRGFGEVQEQPISPAVARAALISAHGAMQWFFPYFGVIPNETHARLEEALAASHEVVDRRTMRNVLRQFSAALRDGHGWVVDQVDPGTTGVLPVLLDRVGDFPVVARTYTPALHVGDRLLAIDGIEAQQWFENEMARSYGATAGFRFVVAAQELTTSPPGSLQILDGDDRQRTVMVTPVEWPADADLFARSVRSNGWLTDMGAPTAYYVNLDGCYGGGDLGLTNALREAQRATGLILDLRGHPADCGADWDIYTFLRRLIQVSFRSARYRVPMYAGGEYIGDARPFEEAYAPILDGLTYRGPLVLITDHNAVSFAEDVGIMLVGAGRVCVVGRGTAGTTGSISGMQVPGGFAVHFTGMEARWPDESPFFGTGIVPHRTVTPGLHDYASRNDPFLGEAIAEIDRWPGCR